MWHDIGSHTCRRTTTAGWGWRDPQTAGWVTTSTPATWRAMTDAARPTSRLRARSTRQPSATSGWWSTNNASPRLYHRSCKQSVDFYSGLSAATTWIFPEECEALTRLWIWLGDGCDAVIAAGSLSDPVQGLSRCPCLWRRPVDRWILKEVQPQRTASWMMSEDDVIIWLKKVACTRLQSVGFQSWSQFLAVSLQVMWVINPTAGCHYFPPGLQLYPRNP